MNALRSCKHTFHRVGLSTSSKNFWKPTLLVIVLVVLAVVNSMSGGAPSALAQDPNANKQIIQDLHDKAVTVRGDLLFSEWGGVIGFLEVIESDHARFITESCIKIASCTNNVFQGGLFADFKVLAGSFSSIFVDLKFELVNAVIVDTDLDELILILDDNLQKFMANQISDPRLTDVQLEQFIAAILAAIEIRKKIDHLVEALQDAEDKILAKLNELCQSFGC